MSCPAFVILAGGKGERLGGQAKQFRNLEGRPVWAWSLETARQLREEGVVGEIVLVLPPTFDASAADCVNYSDVKTTCGGDSRSLSVLAALREARSSSVLLHDAARPFVSVQLCRRLVRAFNGKNAVIPILAENNALKKVCGNEISAVNRDNIFITQTPQLFPREKLTELLERSQCRSFKDEAELWLQNGESLDCVEGEQLNFKITEDGDWQMAQIIAEKTITVRSGVGYDVHPFQPGRRLVLGGVEIPSRMGLAGHSDADAVCHAVADSILSATGLPDIGTLYPASSAAYKNANSILLLSDALERVRTAGWNPDWISIVVTAQTPKLAPWKDAMIASLERVLGNNTVGITFKSGEGVSPAGSSEALFVWAVSTLKNIKSSFECRS